MTASAPSQHRHRPRQRPHTSKPPPRGRSRAHRSIVAALALAVAFVAAAPAASAFDRGVVVDTDKGGNATVRSAPSTDAAEVATLPDGTPLPDAECLVRAADATAWTKLTGERYIRADLTGFDTRLPSCEQPAPPPSADAVDRPVGAPRGAEEYEYHHSFVLGYTDPRVTAVTPEAITAQILNNFEGQFLYGGCGPRVWAGKQCELDLPGPVTFPIQFDRTWPTGWEFTSLEGTEEGRMRWIRFEVRYNDAGDRLVLDVRAKGPRSALLTSRGAQPVNTILTSVEWRRFAEKVASREDLCDGKPWYRTACATLE